MAGPVDRESAEWLHDLSGGQREAAQARLHAQLVRIARGEAGCWIGCDSLCPRWR